MDSCLEQLRTLKANNVVCKTLRHLGEEGIKRDAWLRRHIDGRWQGMLERRAVQTGRWLDAATGPQPSVLWDRSFSDAADNAWAAAGS